MKNPIIVLATICLAVGGVFGLLGAFVSRRNLQAACWGIDGVALVVAAALLALKFSRGGNDAIAAGFFVFDMGEGVMLPERAGTLAETRPYLRRLGLDVGEGGLKESTPK